MPVTEPSPTRPPIKQEGLSWQQIQTQYGSRYQLPSTAPEAVGNRYTTVETPQGLQFYYRKPVPPQQYGRDYEVKNLAVMAKEGLLQPTSIPRPAQYGRDYEVKDLASIAKTIPKEPATSQTPWVDWEQPSRMGVPSSIFQEAGGYREVKEPSMFERMTSIIKSGTVFKSTPIEFEDPEKWFGDPITGKYGINPQGREAGATYAWSAWDVYDIATTVVLVGTAAKAVSTAVKASSLASKLPELPQWAKNIPEAMYYEFVKPSMPYKAVSWLGGELGPSISGMRGVASDIVMGSPIGSVARGIEVTRYFAPEIAGEIGGFISTSRTYMATRYLGVQATELASEITGLVATSRPYMVGRYLGMQVNETVAALGVWRQTLTPLSWQIETSTPYMTFQYGKQLLGEYLPTTMPSMALNYLKQEAIPYAKSVFLPNLSVGIQERISSSEIVMGIRNVGTQVSEKVSWYGEEFAFMTKEVAKRGAYEASWIVTKEFPSMVQRGYDLIKPSIPTGQIESVIERLKIEFPYIKEFGKRVAYEIRYPIEKQGSLLKFYLEQELYKTPQGIVQPTDVDFSRQIIPYAEPSVAQASKWLGKEIHPMIGELYAQKGITSLAGLTQIPMATGQVALTAQMAIEIPKIISTGLPSTITKPFISGAALATIFGVGTAIPRKAWWEWRGQAYPKIIVPTSKTPTTTYPQFTFKPSYPTMTTQRTSQIQTPKTINPMKDFIGFAPASITATRIGQGQVSIQRQAQKTAQIQRYRQQALQDFMRTSKTKTKDELFDFSGRTRLFYPIKSAREVAGL